MGTTKNKPIVDTLREAARILAEKRPENLDNIYDALIEAMASNSAYSLFSTVLERMTCDENVGVCFDDNHERVVFLLFAAEIAATGDL